MVLSALFIAIGLVLPFLTGSNPTIAKIMSPMHIPILLCGMVCGWKYGLLTGIITPLLRSLLFGMPVLMPNAVGMAFELGTYGLVIGLLYIIFRKKGIVGIYISLIIAIIAGRIVWGLISPLTYGIAGDEFSFAVFLAKGFTNQIPGTITTLIIVPLIMVALLKAGLADGPEK
ncbi:MAG: ECF transporter S component [Lachnospiraceae bacterium]|nr:ECF transporter S component [Lachnospiraceae bacterium]